MKSVNKNLGTFLTEYGVFLALAFLVAILSFVSPEFRQAGNFMNLLRQASFNGLIAFGMTCVIISGGIDLSVGSTFALSSIVCAEMIAHGVPVVVAIPVALLVGATLGVVSGVLVTKGRLQPFIATLITMTAYRGLAMIFTDGKPISRLADSAGDGAFLFKALGKGNVVFDFLPAVKIPIPIIILLVAFGVTYFVLRRTVFGRRLYATGSNAKCAVLSGVHIDRVKICVYGVSGFLSALAGLIMISRVDSAQPIMGTGYELDAIAAVALGGTSMNGGRGRIAGTIAGVLIIAVLNNGLNILGVTSYYQAVVKAVVILVAVLADRKR